MHVMPIQNTNNQISPITMLLLLNRYTTICCTKKPYKYNPYDISACEKHFAKVGFSTNAKENIVYENVTYFNIQKVSDPGFRQDNRKTAKILTWIFNNFCIHGKVNNTPIRYHGISSIAAHISVPYMTQRHSGWYKSFTICRQHNTTVITETKAKEYLFSFFFPARIKIIGTKIYIANSIGRVHNEPFTALGYGFVSNTPGSEYAECL